MVTADDFGLARELDRGIEEACTQGVVTHTSLIANGEGTEEAARFLTRHPEISAGLHLNLTDGRPLSSGKRIQALLHSEGIFLGTHWKVAFTCLTRPHLLEPIEREYRAQIERALSLGVRLAQLNCHGHLHGTPPLLNLLVKLALEYRIPFVRVIEELPPLEQAFRSPKQGLKSFLLTLSFRLAQLRVVRTGEVKLNRCQGVFDSGRLTQKRLKQILSRLRDGLTELVCHPGCADEDLKRRYPWNYHWEEERKLLISSWVKEELQRLQVQPLNFWEAKDLPVRP